MLFDLTAGGATSVKFPLINTLSTDDAIYVSCILPGVKKEDITVSVNGRNLVISASATELEKYPDNEGLADTEASPIFRSRTLLLPAKYAGTKNVEASYANGLLKLVVKPDESDKHTIQIK